MKIDSIEVYLTRMPLISPWRAGHGDEAAIESVFVKNGLRDARGLGRIIPACDAYIQP